MLHTIPTEMRRNDEAAHRRCSGNTELQHDPFRSDLKRVLSSDTDQSPPLLIRVIPTAGGALFCLQNVAFPIVE
jgi:hypothetical protein